VSENTKYACSEKILTRQKKLALSDVQAGFLDVEGGAALTIYIQILKTNLLLVAAPVS
jgi:hypothetical protein